MSTALSILGYAVLIGLLIVGLAALGVVLGRMLASAGAPDEDHSH